MLELVPITLKEANAFVERYHRHHKPVAGHKFSIAASDGEKIVGVAIVGRPVSRYLDNGLTLEVNRLCTDGTRNACSFLYSAAWRAARNLGYKKLITYILVEFKYIHVMEIGKKGARHHHLVVNKIDTEILQRWEWLDELITRAEHATNADYHASVAWGWDKKSPLNTGEKSYDVGNIYQYYAYSLAALLAGGHWHDGANCGARAVNCINYPCYVATGVGARGACDSL